MHNQCIGRRDWEKRYSHVPCRIMKMGVNGASTIFRVSAWGIKGQCIGYCEYTIF